MKTLRNGTILIEATSDSQSRQLLLLESFMDIAVIISSHRSLNSSKGIIRSSELRHVSDDDMKKGIEPYTVSTAKRITYRRDGKEMPTNAFLLTFDTPTLPTEVRVSYLQLKMQPYIPNPLRCFNCQKYGHHNSNCRSQATCANCGSLDHTDSN